jgi:hypothetical protein
VPATAAAWHRFSRDNFSFVDRQPQTAAEDLGMTSLLEAQKKRIQELEAELEAQTASVNKLQAENERFREREQEELGVLVSPEPAGCEAAASLKAAESLRAASVEAAASLLPQRIMPTGLAPAATAGELLQQQQILQQMQAIQLPGNVYIYIKQTHTETPTHTHIVQFLQQRRIPISSWRHVFENPSFLKKINTHMHRNTHTHTHTFIHV